MIRYFLDVSYPYTLNESVFGPKELKDVIHKLSEFLLQLSAHNRVGMCNEVERFDLALEAINFSFQVGNEGWFEFNLSEQKTFFE